MKPLHLITIGRKTGQAHTSELLSFELDGKLVIIASNYGNAKHPDWFRNVQANPQVTVRIGKREIAATAGQADATLRKKLWPMLVSQAPRYADYQNKTKRMIPMFLLTLQNK